MYIPAANMSAIEAKQASPSPITPNGLFHQKTLDLVVTKKQNTFLYYYKEPCALHSMQVSLLDIISLVDKLSCSVMGW